MFCSSAALSGSGNFIKFDLNLSLGLLPHGVNLEQRNYDDDDDIDCLDDNKNSNDDKNIIRIIRIMMTMTMTQPTSSWLGLSRSPTQWV